MSPVTETVSFMHASPILRNVWLLRLNKQVLWGIMWWISSFFTLTTHQYNQRSHYQWFSFLSPWVDVTSFLSFPLFYLCFLPHLIRPFFFTILLEATCSNCWHKQYATNNPTYTLQFTTISSFNFRKKRSPLQLFKSSNSQTNAVDHILCDQCVRFLSKDTKSKDFADLYPSFLWNLLAGNYNAVYSGRDLLHMIPSTMRPWWIHSLTESGQDWCFFCADKFLWHLPDHYLTIAHLAWLTSWRM